MPKLEVLVGSKNKTKLEAVERAFSIYFPEFEVNGIEVKSGVPEQPKNEEIYKGAKNRTLELRKLNSKADFFVGIESGIELLSRNWFCCGVIYISDREGKENYGKSPHFKLPNEMLTNVLAGEELNRAKEEYFIRNRVESSETLIEFLTNGIIDRTELYKVGVIMALIPFINKRVYKEY